jgi:hypothetical protein
VPGWAILGQEAVWLEGPDAVRFANAQLTADVRAMPLGGGAACGWLDDRGRILGFGVVFRPGERAVAVVPESLSASALLEFLDSRHFVDDLQLSRRDGALVSLQGCPELVPPLRERASGAFVHRRSPWGEGVDLWLEVAQIEALPGDQRVDPAGVERWRLAAGLLRWPDDGGPKALPHELGWRRSFLAFGKGCYVGQEAIQRIEVLGGVRRCPRGLVGLTPSAAPGDEVRWEGRPAGVVGTVFGVKEGTRALALLRNEVPLGAEVDLPAGRAVVVDLPWSDVASW